MGNSSSAMVSLKALLVYLISFNSFVGLLFWSTECPLLTFEVMLAILPMIFTQTSAVIIRIDFGSVRCKYLWNHICCIAIITAKEIKPFVLAILSAA